MVLTRGMAAGMQKYYRHNGAISKTLKDQVEEISKKRKEVRLTDC